MIKLLFVIHDNKNLEDFIRRKIWTLDCKVFVKLNNRQFLSELDPVITVSTNYDNLGYFGGFHQLAKEFHILESFIISNCDVRVTQENLSDIERRWCNRDAVFGPLLVSEDRKIPVQPPALRRNGFNTLYRRLNTAKLVDEINVDYLAGSFLYFGRGQSLIDLLNYPYFLYCEEIYLSNVSKKLGIPLVFDPYITVEHDYDEFERRRNNFRRRQIRKNLFKQIMLFETGILRYLAVINWLRVAFRGGI